MFLAEHKSSREVYAIKSLKKDLIVQEDDVECTLNERKVLALNEKPPFLTALHSCFQTRDHLFFVMEYINGGDLMFHILELGRFPESQTRYVFASMSVSCKFCRHEQTYVYIYVYYLRIQRWNRFVKTLYVVFCSVTKTLQVVTANNFLN